MQAPSATSIWVRIPAGLWVYSRSAPTTRPMNIAHKSRAATSSGPRAKAAASIVWVIQIPPFLLRRFPAASLFVFYHAQPRLAKGQKFWKPPAAQKKAGRKGGLLRQPTFAGSVFFHPSVLSNFISGFPVSPVSLEVLTKFNPKNQQFCPIVWGGKK